MSEFQSIIRLIFFLQIRDLTFVASEFKILFLERNCAVCKLLFFARHLTGRNANYWFHTSDVYGR